MSAVLGTVLGIGVFLLVAPALAAATLIRARATSPDLTPAVWRRYLGLLVGVPLAAAAAALAAAAAPGADLSARRDEAGDPATAVAVAACPLAAGVVLYIAGALATSSEKIGAPTYPGLLVTLVGLVIAGPWLTSALARLSGRVLSGASPLLATKRLADDPKLAFRAVRGLVLAVFLGTIVGVLVPVIESLVANQNSAALSDVLLDTFSRESPPAPATRRSPPRA